MFAFAEIARRFERAFVPPWFSERMWSAWRGSPTFNPSFRRARFRAAVAAFSFADRGRARRFARSAADVLNRVPRGQRGITGW